MKKISYEKLLERMAKEYSRYYELDFEVNYYEMRDKLSSANSEYDEKEEKDLYHIEFSKVGKMPEIFEWYEECILDNNGNVIDTNYYID